MDEVSFRVEPGSIFGLLGPNGAGKTTLIRIIMGILGADSGEVRYQGTLVTRLESRRFGYLPEERGLYQKTRLRETLVYLARLKGLALEEATSRVDGQLERFALQDYAHKPIQALSKGNQQRVQFIAAVLHRPEVLILDEPFAGLDPLNLAALKDTLVELREQGTAILLSTHQMAQVEQLCQALCLIDQGRVVLEGSLADVKGGRGEAAQRGQRVEVTFESTIPEGVERYLSVEEVRDTTVTGRVSQDANATLKALLELGPVRQFRLREPTLEEIFIAVVRRGPS